jgi:uncharacterized protein YqjF (DUF2071 family)
MPLDDLRFTPALMTRPPPRGLAAETSLRHFSIVTFCVDPDRLRVHLHPRFEPDIIPDAQGVARALVSVVTFLDEDFRFVACPWPRNTFGQTNYRSYVTDTATGEQIVELITSVRDQRGTTIVLVTNDPEVAAAADRILRFRDGQIEEAPTPAEAPRSVSG